MANEARNTDTRPLQVPVGGLLSLSAKDTTGAGTDFTLPHAFKEFSVFAFRASTGSSGGSTKASLRLQGSVANSSKWITLGAATMAVNSASAAALGFRSTNAVAVTRVRLSVNSFTTSAGANPDKIKVTGWITVPPGA